MKQNIPRILSFYESIKIKKKLKITFNNNNKIEMHYGNLLQKMYVIHDA